MVKRNFNVKKNMASPLTGAAFPRGMCTRRSRAEKLMAQKMQRQNRSSARLYSTLLVQEDRDLDKTIQSLDKHLVNIAP